MTISTKPILETSSSQERRYKARRYAVKFDPPCVFLEYEDGTSKRRVRAVKLNLVQPSVDVDRLTRKVIRSFPRKLDAASVKYDQVRKLVVKLVDHLVAEAQHSGGISSASEDTTTSRSSSGNSEKQLLATSDGVSPQLMQGRAMALGLAQNRASVESIDRFTTCSHEEDELSSVLDELDRELLSDGPSPTRVPLYGHTMSPHTSNNSSLLASPELLSRDGSFSVKDRACQGSDSSTSPSAAAIAAANAHKTRFAAEAERLVIDIDLDEETDLNKVTDVELKMAKMKMEQEFLKNQLKPGDPQFQYDKQIHFPQPAVKSEWDDSDDDCEVQASDDEL